MLFSISCKCFCLTLPVFNHFQHKVTLSGSVTAHNHFTLITAGSNHMITVGFHIKAKGWFSKGNYATSMWLMNCISLEVWFKAEQWFMKLENMKQICIHKIKMNNFFTIKHGIKTNFCLTHKYIKSIQGKLPVCTYLQQTWQHTKRVFITQELRSTITYHQPLKIYLVIRINSN